MIYDQIMLAFGWPGPGELILIGLIGVLLFGNRLPDVGRSLGRGIVEFKKGIRGVDEEIDRASRDSDKNTKES
ncbi:MAG: twin-arginine translocase TatA/TatE family subunit [Sedimentisphaerales bacterium]|nr:twin-arginine translocase TatA/TatE family subunit [Sedimentisphaerales bacterium]